MTSLIQTVSSDSRQFVTLDGLRGVAALAIITRHAPPLFGTDGPFPESYLAVDFFFCLSGFVLTHAYRRRFDNKMKLGEFMLVRIVRLYPLYLLSIGLSLVVAAYSIIRHAQPASSLLAETVAAIFFLPSPVSTALFPLNIPAWSLFFELIANAVFALTWRLLTNITLSIFVFVSAIFLAACVLTGQLGFHPGVAAMNAGMDWETFTAGFSRVMFSFFAGVLIYRLWAAKSQSKGVRPIYLAVALIALLVGSGPQYPRLYELFAVLFAFPAIIFLGADSKPNYRMERRALSLLGRSSYAAYVLQAPFFAILWILVYKLFGPSVERLSYVGGAVFAVLVFIFSLMANYYYDTPVRKYLISYLRIATTRAGRAVSLCGSLPRSRKSPVDDESTR
jgi:peptidoglycan/LPS O-acetylase OafA/YrhL